MNSQQNAIMLEKRKKNLVKRKIKDGGEYKNTRMRIYII